jgi:hypothetical protein
MDKYQLAKGLAYFFLCRSRGTTLFDMPESIVKNMIMGGMAIVIVKQLFDLDITPVKALIFYLSYEVFRTIAGFVDLKLGFWKVQNDINTRVMTPFFGKMEKDIETIMENTKK